MIAGHDKVGKSLVLCKLAATVSVGGPWPLGEGKAKLGNVVVISPEDGTADTLRPRLEAAGADLGRIFVRPMGTSDFDLDTGLKRLAKLIRQIDGVRMVQFDPASALLGSISRNDGNAIRALFTRLAAFASEYRLAVVLTAHINKSKTVAGSFEWLAAARAAFLVACEPDTDQRLFVPRPSTLAKETSAITFTIREKTLANGMVAPAVRWRNPVDLTFQDAMAAATRKTADQKRGEPPRSEAAQFLLDALRGGHKKSKDIIAMGQSKGVTPKMLRTARKTLGVVSKRVGGLGPRGWHEWSLRPS